MYDVVETADLLMIRRKIFLGILLRRLQNESSHKYAVQMTWIAPADSLIMQWRSLLFQFGTSVWLNISSCFVIDISLETNFNNQISKEIVKVPCLLIEHCSVKSNIDGLFCCAIASNRHSMDTDFPLHSSTASATGYEINYSSSNENSSLLLIYRKRCSIWNPVTGIIVEITTIDHTGSEVSSGSQSHRVTHNGRNMNGTLLISLQEQGSIDFNEFFRLVPLRSWVAVNVLIDGWLNEWIVVCLSLFTSIIRPTRALT